MFGKPGMITGAPGISKAGERCAPHGLPVWGLRDVSPGAQSTCGRPGPDFWMRPVGEMGEQRDLKKDAALPATTDFCHHVQNKNNSTLPSPRNCFLVFNTRG